MWYNKLAKFNIQNNKNNMEENTSCCSKFGGHKPVLVLVGAVLVSAIVMVSILRERIVNPNQNQVTVFGQGKVSYQPDEADVTLGVQVDKVFSADDALRQLSQKIARIIEAEKALGIKEDDIKAESYNLHPQYDYNNGTSTVSGYNASEQLVIKVKDIISNPDLVGQIISGASGAGANQVLGVNYDISNINDLKQQARIAAIADAKSKAPALFAQAGVRSKKVTGWYENNTGAYPENQADYAGGIGGAGGLGQRGFTPQVPSGQQEIIIEVGVNYEIK
jgi:hypothetical protein